MARSAAEKSPPLEPRFAADVRQIGLPPLARPRRITQARVAAVCEQLGEDHVSVRNVQRVLGGSFRDLSPKIKTWRETRAHITSSAESSATEDRVVARLCSVLLGAVTDIGQSLQDQLTPLQRRLDALTSVLPSRPVASSPEPTAKALSGVRQEVHGLHTDVRRLLERPPAAQLPAELDTRLQRLQQAIESLQVAAPAPERSPAPSPWIEQLEQLASAVDRLVATSRVAHDTREDAHSELRSRLDQLAQDLRARDTPTPAPVDVTGPLTLLSRQLAAVVGKLDDLARQQAAALSREPAWGSIDARLGELQILLQAAAKPAPARPGLTKALAARLEAITAALTALQVQTRPASPPRKRSATKKVAKKPRKTTATRVRAARRTTKPTIGKAKKTAAAKTRSTRALAVKKRATTTATAPRQKPRGSAGQQRTRGTKLATKKVASAVGRRPAAKKAAVKKIPAKKAARTRRIVAAAKKTKRPTSTHRAPATLEKRRTSPTRKLAVTAGATKRKANRRK